MVSGTRLILHADGHPSTDVSPGPSSPTPPKGNAGLTAMPELVMKGNMRHLFTNFLVGFCLVCSVSAVGVPAPIVLVSYQYPDAFDVNPVLTAACSSLLDHFIEDAKSRRVRGPGSDGNSQGDIDLRRLLAVKADPVEAARIPEGVAYVVVVAVGSGIRVAFYWPENMYSYSCTVDPKSYKIIPTSSTARVYAAILPPRSPADSRGARKWKD